jgi:type III restriction enzyme
MKLILKDFQEVAVENLYIQALDAKRSAQVVGEQALVLASPTGSGKTMIATHLMERILEGDDDHVGDEEATFLWLTDQPDLNEQSKRKILSASSVFGFPDVRTIEADFDQERFDPGKAYFLNIQKLGKGTHLVSAGDERNYTIWETISNTIEATPGSFWLVLDEAHKGMLEDKEQKLAATIVQKFVKGSPNEIPAVPLILGISATPERFVELLKGTGRIQRPVTVNPEDVRASGLLKETIALFHPTERQPSDWSLLRASAEKLNRYAERWDTYWKKEGDPLVEPVLVVQVEDGKKGQSVSETDLEKVLADLEDAFGRPLADDEIGHSFDEHSAIPVGDRSLRYVSPSDIQDDEALHVVLFKKSLNTGWDCPRAEVIMSFRKAEEYTNIAQLVGRLVRTPLARSIHANDFLNSVSLYLPHYDKKALKKVIDYLSKPETGLAAAPEFIEGDDLLELPRDEEKGELFELAETLPTYTVERVSKASNVRRLIRLGRALTYDKLDPTAFESFRQLVISTLNEERKRLAKTAAFKKAIKEGAQIDVRGVKVTYGVESEDEELDESFEAVAAVSRNIDDLHSQSGRKLGEGLHIAYVKARVSSNSIKPGQAKLELATLLDDAKTAKKLEDKAGKLFQAETDKHKAAIRDLSEARRDTYRKLRRQAAKPQSEELELPELYPTKKNQETYKKHLYADENGDFSCKLQSEWEEDVVAAELARGDELLGWLRNIPRKSWALCIPYDHDGDRPMFPDFLFFRKQGDGLVVDVLEPHSLNQDDSSSKAKGLADFAAEHGDDFGRIELIIKEKGKLLRLDVNQDAVRDKVRAVSDNQHLKQLFESAG